MGDLNNASIGSQRTDRLTTSDAVRKHSPPLQSLATEALRLTNLLSNDAVSSWKQLRSMCVKEGMDFVSFLCEHEVAGKSLLERIILSGHWSVCRAIHAIMEDKTYAMGRVRKTPSLLVVNDDQDPRKAFGFQKLCNNGHYMGEFCDDLREGRGAIDTRFGVTYKGDWLADKRHGYGFVTNESEPKKSYEGIFVEGAFKGDIRKRKTDQNAWPLNKLSVFPWSQ